MQFNEIEVGDTLAQINMVRTAMGYQPLTELPTSVMGSPSSCLYYRALADCGATGVYADKVQFSSERQAQLVADLWGTRTSDRTVKTPPQMSKMISDFDHKQFPHYNIRD